MILDGIEVFVRVVQAGSFSGAAKLMGMPITTVSGKVAALEKRLGVQLIHRTTRQLHITQAGEAYYRRCRKAVEEMEAGEQELVNSNAEPEGTLRLTAPVDVSHIVLPPIIGGYLAAYPKVNVEMIVTNRVVDLVGEGVDLAIRAGGLKSSTMVSRKFLESAMSFWRAPSYQAPPLKHPRELNAHSCILFSLASTEWELQRGREKFLLEAGPRRLVADDFSVVKAFVIEGQGIGLIPDFLCAAEEQSGKLLRVLPEWTSLSSKLTFVYPPQRFVAPRVTSFIQWATGKKMSER